MTYRPDRRRRRIPPEKPDPFHAEDELLDEIVPPPEPTTYMSEIKDGKRYGVAETPKDSYQVGFPGKILNQKPSEKKSGLLRKL